MVDGPFEEMFAEEPRGTSFLLYLQFLSSHDLGENTTEEHTFVASVSLKCGPSFILTSHSCRRFWSFGKPKNPTLFPSGSTVPSFSCLDTGFFARPPLMNSVWEAIHSPEAVQE